MSRSKPIWETQKRWNRWKPVSNELKDQLEAVFDEQEKKEKEGIMIDRVVEVPGTHLKVQCTSYLQHVEADVSAIKRLSVH